MLDLVEKPGNLEVTDYTQVILIISLSHVRYVNIDI